MRQCNCLSARGKRKGVRRRTHHVHECTPPVIDIDNTITDTGIP